MDLPQMLATAAVVVPTAAFAIATGVGSFFTVEQGHERLVTRFGKMVGEAASAGLHFKIPFIDKASHPVSTQLQQVKDRLATKTNDNIFVELPISIQFEVKDTAQFTFANEKPVEQIQSLVNAAVRTHTSDKDFQHLYSDRDQISQAVIAAVKDDVENYGVVLRRIVIDEPHAPGEIQTAYNRVRASEREREAATNEAEANFIRRVKEAEADKQRNILIGEGVAGFRERIAAQYAEQAKKLQAAGIAPEEASNMMMQAMHLDTIRDVGEKGNMVIVVPNGDAGAGIANTMAAMRAAKAGPAPVAA